MPGIERKSAVQTDRIIAHITDWLKGYAAQAGLEGFVAGVSGGIDSAVTSTLCARTGLQSLLLNMPIHQSAAQHDLAAAHIRWVTAQHANAQGVRVDLTPVFDSLRQALPHEIQDDLSMANTRARLRMTTLYAFAGHHRLLVAGTGNKVEDFGVGFFTKYGDGGVDLSPIADLVKTEVYAIGQALGVAPEILAAAPTDGLWEDGRTDEGQIGASYPELEWAMDFEASGGDMQNLTSRQKEILTIFHRFNRTNRHKMTPIPVCHIPPALRRAAGD